MVVAQEAQLTIEDVHVQYGTFLALRGFSLTLRSGDLLGLVGPNGAGKSTAMRAAAGLQPISAGRIRVAGFDITRHPVEVGHYLGFTPDTPNLYESLRVADFLEFVGDCYGLPRTETRERIDHWLEKLWLKEKRDSRIQELSRGMRQRLAVARTLLPDPWIILLDEPAGGLDPGGRIQFRRLLADLRDAGKVIIVSSHILSDLAEYCTHIAIMEHGQLRHFGTVSEVERGERTDTCAYRVGIASRLGDLESRLRSAEVTRFTQDGDVLTIEWGHGKEEAAKLLKILIAAEVPVTEFVAIRPDLEQVYLRSGISQVD